MIGTEFMQLILQPENYLLIIRYPYWSLKQRRQLVLPIPPYHKHPLIGYILKNKRRDLNLPFFYIPIDLLLLNLDDISRSHNGRHHLSADIDLERGGLTVWIGFDGDRYTTLIVDGYC